MKHSVLLSAVLMLGAAPMPGMPAHHAMVMQHGRQVMPFDQGLAVHIFTPDDRGGTLRVTVPNRDSKQIALVRSHLRNETKKFTAGDFSDPAYIHGRTMPGLAALSAGAARMKIVYSYTPSGAEIAFRTTDAGLIKAIHAWLAAQQHDHNAR